MMPLDTLKALEEMLSEQSIDTLTEWRRTPRWRVLRRWALRGAWAPNRDWLRRIRTWKTMKEETP